MGDGEEEEEEDLGLGVSWRGEWKGHVEGETDEDDWVRFVEEVVACPFEERLYASACEPGVKGG